MTRPTLRELARERGAIGSLKVTVCGRARHISAWTPSGLVWVGAPTRRAAEAGLRAALLALPVKKEKKR